MLVVGPASVAGPVLLVPNFGVPLTTFVEPVQTGFSARPQSLFMNAPTGETAGRVGSGASRYEKNNGR